MAEETNNAVRQLPLLPPPGYHFRPTNSELFRHYLYDRVTRGFCQWNIISDTDILAVPPWDLPGMESNKNVGYYFSARESKSKGAGFDRSNRRIKVDEGAFWKMSLFADVWEGGLKWGRKNTLNFFTGPGKRSEWLMYEFVLDHSLAEGSNREHIVLCKVYKKKNSKEEGKKRERPALEGSHPKGKKVEEIVPLHDIDFGQPLKQRRMDAAAASFSAANCFPQLNQRTLPGNGASSSAAPYVLETTHLEVAIPPPTASFSSAEPYIEGIHPAPEAEPCTTDHHCTNASTCTSTIAPVDDPKLCYQPAAFGSAEPHIQKTHPAAAAAPCTMAASSLSCVAPIHDPKLFFTAAEWEQEIQNYLSFDPADQLDDYRFDEEYFAPFFRM